MFVAYLYGSLKYLDLGLGLGLDLDLDLCGQTSDTNTIGTILLKSQRYLPKRCTNHEVNAEHDVVDRDHLDLPAIIVWITDCRHPSSHGGFYSTVGFGSLWPAIFLRGCGCRRRAHSRADRKILSWLLWLRMDIH